jgi:hypothetical protein
MDYATIPVTLDNINSHYNGGNNSDQIIQSPYMEIANDNAHAKVSINTDPVSQNKSLEVVQDFDKDNNDDMHPDHNNTPINDEDQSSQGSEFVDATQVQNDLEDIDKSK